MILHFCFCYQWHILLDGNRGNCGLWMPGIYPALWQTAVPSCCLRRTALIVYSLEGHSVTVSRLPSSTGWVAKPQQGSLQLTQVLLSCEQEDQDHALNSGMACKIWKARPHSGHLSCIWRKPEARGCYGKWDCSAMLRFLVQSVTRLDFPPAFLLKHFIPLLA